MLLINLPATELANDTLALVTEMRSALLIQLKDVTYVSNLATALSLTKLSSGGN